METVTMSVKMTSNVKVAAAARSMGRRRNTKNATRREEER